MQRIRVEMSMRSYYLSEDSKEKLSQTEFTQPAILLVSSVAHRLFIDETGIKPTSHIGTLFG